VKFTATDLTGVVLIEPEIFGDQRGFVMESWHARKFAEFGITTTFVQDNHSRSARGILRGLHMQRVHTQGKLVRVVRGEVFDVVVDLRKDSPQFGKWLGFELSEQNSLSVWVPPGFGHGFYVMSELADVICKCTDFYVPEHEFTLRWDDSEVGVRWPLVNGRAPTLSAKDAKGLTLSQAKELL
jgi:dTDP-4-dehydrorhamnose 3,5-epimerase